MKRENRLKSNQDFIKVRTAKKYVACHSLTIYYIPNELKLMRIGISVNGRLGISVVRNRAKRQLKDLVRQVIDVSLSYDLVIVVREKFINQSYKDSLRDLNYVYQKFIKENKNEKI